MSKYITKQELQQYNRAGLFNIDNTAIRTQDAGFGGVTTANVNFPAGILSQISPFMVNVLTRTRTANQVVGRNMKLLDWAKADLYIPLVEPKGETKQYSDFGNPPKVSMNLNYVKAGHYRFSDNVVVGRLESAQLSQTRISAEEKSLSTALENLAIRFNEIAFEGVEEIPDGSQYPVYGVLNHPDLPAYVTLSTTSSTSADDLFNTFYNDVLNLINSLIAQAQGHVTPNSKMVLAISNQRAKLLSVINPLGNRSLRAVIADTYPNLEWVLAPELDGAYNDCDVMYLRAETLEETLSKETGISANDIIDSAVIGFSELAISGAVEAHSNYTLQTLSSGSLGAIVTRPYMFARGYFPS